jgi:hypothetical protein
MLRSLVLAASVLLAVAAFVVLELLGLCIALPVLLVLGPTTPIVVAAGLLLGLAALAAGAVRRRAGDAAGGVTDGDLVVHAALLGNTVLLAASFAGRSAVPGDAGQWLLGAGVAAGGIAIVGVPVSVLCSWRRSFTAPTPGPSRLRRSVLGLSNLANVALAGALLPSAIGPIRDALLGSLAT